MLAAAEADAETPLRDVLAAALEANERLARLAEELRAENARLREELARRDAQIEQMAAELAVLQRLVFGRSSERARPDATAGDESRDRAGGGQGERPRGPGARAVMAPGPPKAIGKGLFTNGFIAMLLAERYVAGLTGLARQGPQISPATLAGTVAAAGALLAPLEEAITARSRDSWHLHADETSWQVFAPREGDGPARWWLWVFLGPDTACFVMDPTRAGAVLARHAGIESPAALGSYYIRQVEFELAFTRLAAEGRDSFILPIIIQKLDRPLPLRLASRYYLDFTNRKQYSKNMTSLVRKVSLQDPKYSGRRWYKGLDISPFGEPMGIGEIAQMASNGPSYEIVWEQGTVVQVDVYQNGKKVNYKNFGYDSQGRVIENRMYSPDGRGGWHLADDVWYYTYDPKSSRRIKKLMKFPGASSGREVSYDDHGRAIEENIVNEGKLDMSYGYARKSFDYSPEGHVVCEHWFDYHGDLVKTVERDDSR